MEWILLIRWYSVIFLFGIIFFPLAKIIFGRVFTDQGYGFSKIIGILLTTYVVFVLGTAKLLPFSSIGIILILAVAWIINYLLWKKTSENKYSAIPYKLIVIEELLFIVSLLFWTYIRGQEPSIRSLEKFMDFGFMNSIMRSRFFPPLDIWLSADPGAPQGYSINYYYFGHLTGALLMKISGVKTSIGYNLILNTLFALGIVQTFSLIVNIIHFLNFTSIKDKVISMASYIKTIVFGLLGSFLLNLGGNLHTIYLFTKGYPNEQPVPFWQILSGFNPMKYWYPNATRFIPFTIHEFPSYSYVVADLHGHVFDIPFVLLTLAILFIFFVTYKESKLNNLAQNQQLKIVNKFQGKQNYNLIFIILNSKFLILNSILLGFLTAIHYMTNAFDGPIYLLLSLLVFFFLSGLTKRFLTQSGFLIISFIIFSLPFSMHFKPFVSGIGVNCSPAFLTDIGKIGPFLFEKNNCQISPLWMLFILWGFFWINFLILSIIHFFKKNNWNQTKHKSLKFMALLFSFGILLTIIPEFFYIKDIYPAHFRANTMFKLGYQAYIIMMISSIYTLIVIKQLEGKTKFLFSFIFVFLAFFVAAYPFFSIPSYYGNLDRKIVLDGSAWMKEQFPEDADIIQYINANIDNQPVILEAQGDSYTDFERISAYTGLPTVAGWWVHEWLWRGSPNVVGNRIPDIVNMYESKDIKLTQNLLRKYKVKYVIISKMEKQKYPNLYENKFMYIGKRIFLSDNGFGALYQVD